MSASFRMGLVAVFCAMLCAIAANATPIDYIFTAVYSRPSAVDQLAGTTFTRFPSIQRSGLAISIADATSLTFTAAETPEPASASLAIAEIGLVASLR